MTVAYLYKWIHIPSGMWYIGSKSANGCHPDFHESYICSKKTVKTAILENREDWSYSILETGEPGYIRKRETEILVSLDAKKDPMSFNESNAKFDPGNRLGRKESKVTRERKSIARCGSKNPMYGKRGIDSPHYGKKHSDETKLKQRSGIKRYSRQRPQLHNDNIRKSLVGNQKLKSRTGPLNHMYGKTASDYNKAMSKLKNAGELNPMKRPENQVVCEICGKTVAKNHYTMYHGVKCKGYK